VRTQSGLRRPLLELRGLGHSGTGRGGCFGHRSASHRAVPVVLAGDGFPGPHRRGVQRLHPGDLRHLTRTGRPCCLRCPTGTQSNLQLRRECNGRRVDGAHRLLHLEPKRLLLCRRSRSANHCHPVSHIDYQVARGAKEGTAGGRAASVWQLFKDHPLVIFLGQPSVACVPSRRTARRAQCCASANRAACTSPGRSAVCALDRLVEKLVESVLGDGSQSSSSDSP
jgi:hypothetical protein